VSAIVTRAFLRISELVAESTNLVSVAHRDRRIHGFFSEFQSRSIVELALIPLGLMTSCHDWHWTEWRPCLARDTRPVVLRGRD